MDETTLELLRNLPARVQADPVGNFLHPLLGCTAWEKQEAIIRSVFAHKKTTVRSGNSVGKTYIAARVVLAFLFAFPNSVVISTAPSGRQVANQLWREIRDAHANAKVPLGGQMLQTSYSLDEKWYALGFSTRPGGDGMERFQGWHAPHILFLVDEASGVHPSVFEAILGGLAAEGARLLLIGNPTKPTGDFYDSFGDPTFNHLHISAFDVPNVQQGREVVPGLATKEWVAGVAAKYGVDSDIYRVRVLGEFPRKDSSTLIPLDLVVAAIDAERERENESDEWLGMDIARRGSDRTALVHRIGNWAKVLAVLDKNDVMEAAGLAKKHLLANPKARLMLDSTGLGAGAFDRLKEQPDVADRVFGSNAAGKAADGAYLNARAEMWDLARLWLRGATLEAHEGWYQLAKPRYKLNSAGKVQLESKEDMGKRGVPSPDVGDALALTFANANEGERTEIVYV